MLNTKVQLALISALRLQVAEKSQK